jgi:hypothetical protein
MSIFEYFKEVLSEITSAYLSTLTYRSDAKRLVCWLPISGIYWEDEMPDTRLLRKIPEDDFNQIMRLFGIRSILWKNESLTEDDERFWDTTRSQVPSWAFFRRRTISVDDQNAQDQAERAAAEVVEALTADADELSIVEKDGVRTVSATFKLTKEVSTVEKKQSWWERLFSRRR